jgi:hypothetical protein
MALGSTQPLVIMSTRNIPGGKGDRSVRLTSPPSCAECHEIWEPKPPGTLWATPVLLRDCFIFFNTYDLQALQRHTMFLRSLSNISGVFWIIPRAPSLLTTTFSSVSTRLSQIWLLRWLRRKNYQRQVRYGDISYMFPVSNCTLPLLQPLRPPTTNDSL